ncbi:Hypothetical protein, putative [Bodo saltans]|uniref:Transmembrane protein n=1 Tax=Bodo saltans TaxID=75058 RepID=A0A0S4ILS1_BODSA|nr:Hypothetical protein, putative [Bodo saltans]|eukprot:CUE71970.1 Hypothetical protein, putative [Bodo saltans]
MNFLVRYVSQLLLFASGPFYTYPWKPIINALIGHSYPVALQHFKKAHYGLVNLALHGVCLFVQVAGNFGLLRRLDELLLGIPANSTAVNVKSLSFVSAAIWCVPLLLSPAPKLISLASTAVIFAMYVLTAGLTIPTFELLASGGFATVLILSNLLASSKKKLPVKKVIAATVGVLGWFAGSKYLLENHWGAAATIGNALLIGNAAFFALTPALKNPLKLTVIVGATVSKLIGIATGSELVTFHSYAFFGSLCQGIAHALTKEEATLLALERESEDAKIRSEYAHVVYFPNIFLQTAYDALFRTKGQN